MLRQTGKIITKSKVIINWLLITMPGLIIDYARTDNRLSFQLWLASLNRYYQALQLPKMQIQPIAVDKKLLWNYVKAPDKAFFSIFLFFSKKT